MQASEDSLRRALESLRSLREKYERLEAAQHQPIAIVGMGCRLPGGANDPQSLWSMLDQGRDAVVEVPRDRWNIDDIFDANPDAPGKVYTRSGGFIEQVDRFDPNFFGIAPREAASMDPQQRLFLEVVWEALEHAGIAPDSLTGSATGVFLGISTNDYRELETRTRTAADLDAYFGTGNVFSVAAGRVSYLLGLQGPNMAIDTACSSSLVATHLAMQSLRVGDCRTALVGGVNVMLSPMTTVYFCKLKALSPDGRCKAFDASANGYGRGEGCGVLVLKRLEDAVHDRDQIYAVLRGSAINHDGRSNGLTAPNGLAQEQALRFALENARLSSDEIDYVEAHGTGTALGDPIELQAISSVYGQRSQPLWLGTIKANIGHLEAAAGVAGLLKAALMLRHKTIPPQLHFHTPSPHVPWSELPIQVSKQGIPFSRTDRPLRIGVSSFGFSGTNAHVVLESYDEDSPAYDSASETPARAYVLGISAKSETSLLLQASKLVEHLTLHSDLKLSDVCYSAGVGRCHFEKRAAFSASSIEQLCTSLAKFCDNPAVAHAASGQSHAPVVAYLFTGQGSQSPGMGQKLFDSEPTFRRALEECEELFREYLEHPLLDVIYPRSATTPKLLDQTSYSQPALFAIEYALAQLWKERGIEPNYVIGHSLGEYTAACVSGVFTLRDTVKLVAHRSRLMQALPPNGSMMAVMSSATEMEPYLRPWRDCMAIAAYNGPREIVVSGEREAISQLQKRLQAVGIVALPLNVSHAFHSPLVAPMLDEFRSIVREVTPRWPNCGYVSNVTGTLLDSSEHLNEDYWVRHVRSPVAFASGIRALMDLGCTAFVELGPTPVLTNLGRKNCPAGADQFQWLPSLKQGKDDREQFAESSAALYSAGANLDWSYLAASGARRIALPTYSFERQRYWLDDQPRSLTAHTSADPSNVYDLSWNETFAIASSEPSAIQQWLIISDEQLVADALSTRLKSQGDECAILNTKGLSEEQDIPSILQSAKTCGVIFLTKPGSVDSAASLLESLGQACQSLLDWISGAGKGSSPKLWIVTRGAMCVHDEQVSFDGQAALWGIGRTLHLEYPEFATNLIDLPRDATPEQVAGWVSSEIAANLSSDQIAIRNGKRFCLRLDRAQLDSDSSVLLNPDACYAITGGLGALGRLTARWLIERGARHLLLLGRHAPGDSAREEIDQLREQATIDIELVDVSQLAALERAFQPYGQSLPELKGVFHLAGVLDDGMLINQDWPRLAAVFTPKSLGAWNLHLATLGRQLDYFVVFSSAAAALGSMGQANYAAANAVADSLIFYRNSLGLPGHTLNWGPWSKVGMAAVRGRIAVSGIKPLDSDRCFEYLEKVLSSKRPQTVVLAADWQSVRLQFGARRPLPLFANLLVETKLEDDFVERLNKQPSAQAKKMLEREVAHQVMVVLGREPSDTLDKELGFFSTGMDSLMAMELRNRLQAKLQQLVELPATLVFDQPSVRKLADWISEKLSLNEPSRLSAPVKNIESKSTAIAVVGIGCRFPGNVNDYATFWELLTSGSDAISEIPATRWDVDRYFDPEPNAVGKMYTRHGGFLSEIENFDAGFFSISPKEALRIDPQQRLLLEVTWEAIENAGISANELVESPTGVYIGISNNDYPRKLAAAISEGDAYLGLGNALSAAAGRLSYTFGFRGPSIAVDTACSSSLVAVHLACQDLQAGRVNFALAGGVNLILTPEVNVQLCKARMLAPDGKCKTFDGSADGYVRGEGCAVVALKRLDDALADGDRIWSVILGSAVNQDGRTGGLTVPNGQAQTDVAREAMLAQHCEPASVQFVEAHGTGTALGDPIEVQALAASYGDGRVQGDELLLGSVKANIGHLEAAAGIAGLVKASLCLAHQQFPPQINFRIPSPHIPWKKLAVRVPTALTPLVKEPARGAVSSFGFVGTNAHVVMEAPPRISSVNSKPSQATPLVLTVSAKSPEALKTLVRKHLKQLESLPADQWASYCLTSNLGRCHFSERWAVAADRSEDAKLRMTEWLSDEAKPSGRSNSTTQNESSRTTACDLAEAYKNGNDIDWQAVHEGRSYQRALLPTYPFERQRYWPDEREQSVARAHLEPVSSSLLGRKIRYALSADVHEAEWNAQTPACLKDHQIFDAVIVPGATYLSMGIQAAHELHGTIKLEFANVAFLQPMTLKSESSKAVQTVLEPAHDAFQVLAEADTGVINSWVCHAQGKLKPAAGDGAITGHASLDELRGRLTTSNAISDFYRWMNQGQLQLGPSFQWIEEVWPGSDESLARLRMAHAAEREEGIFPPGMLDACFQSLATAVNREHLDPTPYVPIGLDRFLVLERPSGPVWVHAKLRPVQGDQREALTADLCLYDESGFVVALMNGLHLKRAAKKALIQTTNAPHADWFVEIQWRPSPLTNEEVCTLPKAIFVVDDLSIEEKLRQHKAFKNCQVILDPTILGESLNASQLSRQEIEHVIYLASGRTEDCRRFLQLIQSLSYDGHATLPRLWLVTTGAHGWEGTAADPLQTALWGMCRVLTLEQPHWSVVCLDWELEQPISANLSCLVQSLSVQDRESQQIWRGGRRYVARLNKVRPPSTEFSFDVDTVTNFGLSTQTKGMLDTLSLQSTPRGTPGEGELEICVHASALNFRDVLNAMDLYPGEAGPLGLETAGVVTAVGPNVTEFKVGDRVLAIVVGAFSRYVIAQADLASHIPTRLSATEACALPVAFLTVEYSLGKLAKLRSGERILIHAASGGVGLAAVQYALRTGAIVYATAGNEEKRSYLRSLGVEHVYSSRSDEFAAKIMAETDGAGVDVILNSLTGEMLPASVQTLAPTGRFVEIGKINIWTLEQFLAVRPNGQYHIFALDQLAAEKPREIGQALRELCHEFEAGLLRPIRCVPFPMLQAPIAFRMMARARHIGKIVLTLDPDQPLSRSLSSDATYLVTGGLGGLGRLVTNWLADRGARNIVVTTRRQPDEDAHRFLEQLRAQQINIQVAIADVTRKSDVEAAVALCGSSLRGVFHLAGLLEDGLLDQMEWSDFEKVFDVKATSAMHLDEATAMHALDFFVLFSSIASLLGSPGQGNYAAANAYLDGLAQRRYSRGLPALSINWGPWASHGMAARLGEQNVARWTAAGIQLLPAQPAIDVLDLIWSFDRPQIGVIAADWAKLSRTAGDGLLPALWDNFRQRTEASGELIRRLTNVPAPARRAVVNAYVREQIGRVLGLSPKQEIDPEQSLRDLGLDSLMAVDLTRGLGTGCERTFPATLVYNYPNLASLSDFLFSEIGSSTTPSQEMAIAAVSDSAKVATTDEPIAIVGMGCRFPGNVNNANDFWELLKSGQDAITEIPASRWDIDAFYDPDPDSPGKMYSRSGGFVENVDRFDASFFGITPREAIGMDPQQRLLLEVTWEALEHAGIAPDQLSGSSTGVFLGISTQDYTTLRLHHLDLTQIDAYFGTGGTASIAAGRLSYVLGLMGPNLAIDTACSSSLVATHLACQALRQGECRQALVGGVNLILSPISSVYFCKLKALAENGRCKSFDAAADGYGRGEGCGVLVLKRLSDAVADGDRVLAVIRGSAVNHDGRSNGLTAPNGAAQERVIRQALASAGLQPSELGYIEAHGTGTNLGDPVEAMAIGKVFQGKSNRAQPLWLGSVKSSIGHLEAAAGVAGIIKSVLLIQHASISPQANFEKPNPFIPWQDLPLKIPTRLEHWDSPEGIARRAGVSSFGFSGTNAHVVLEQAPSALAPVANANVATPADGRIDRVDEFNTVQPVYVLPLSARNPVSLERLAERYSDLESPSVAALCYTAAIGRAQLPYRLCLVGSDWEELKSKLRSQTVSNKSRIEASYGSTSGLFIPKQNRLTSQAIRGLLASYPAIDQAVGRACESLDGHSGIEPYAVFLKQISDDGADLLSDESTFAWHYGLASFWLEIGLLPRVVAGEGNGALIAGVLSGRLSLSNAAFLVLERNNSHWQSLFNDRLTSNSIAAWINGDGELVQDAATLHLVDNHVPDPVALQSAFRNHGAERVINLVPDSDLPDIRAQLLSEVAEHFVRGQTIQWASILHRQPKVTAPSYAWQRERYWPDEASSTIDSMATARVTTDNGDKRTRTPQDGDRVLDDILPGLAIEEQHEAMRKYLCVQIAELAKSDLDRIDPKSSLVDLGLDSLMVLDLLEKFKQQLRIVLYPREFYSRPTIDAIGQYLVEEWNRSRHAPKATRDMTAAQDTAPAVRNLELTVNRESIRNGSVPLPSATFLLSSPRSGSTLLRVMLAGHPELFVPPELHLLPFETMAERRETLGTSFMGEGLQRALMELLQLGAAECQQMIAQWEEDDWSIKQVYDFLQQRINGRMLVDKSPSYAADPTALGDIDHLFENAKVIHLVRHPQAMVESFVRMRMDRLLGAAEVDAHQLAERIWYESNQNLLQLAEHWPADRYHLVRYEDLVVAPEIEMRKICEFLGKSWQPEVLQPYSGNRMTTGVLSQSMPIGDPNFLQHQSIDSSLLDAWKLREPIPLQAASSDLAEQLGYEIARPDAVVPTIVEGQWSANGTSIAYYASGRDPATTALCLHGILDHGWVWEPMAEHLQRERIRIVAPHLRGHGSSSHVPKGCGYHLMDMVSDLDIITSEHINTPAILVGHSLGAIVASLLAVARPERFFGLILVDMVLPTTTRQNNVRDGLVSHLNWERAEPMHTWLPSLEHAAGRLRQAYPILSESRALRWAQRLTHAKDNGFQWKWDQRLTSRAGLAFAGAGALDTQQFSTLLQTLSMPIIFVRGSRSEAVDNEEWCRFAETLPDARTVTLPAGHMVPLEAAEALGRIILDASSVPVTQ